MAEIAQELVTSARKWLRFGTTSQDDEIRQTIMACLIDLSNGGVKNNDPDDEIIQQCIKLYLKAQFGYEDNAQKYEAAYEHLKRGLALSGDYNTEREPSDGETG